MAYCNFFMVTNNSGFGRKESGITDIVCPLVSMARNSGLHWTAAVLIFALFASNIFHASSTAVTEKCDANGGSSNCATAAQPQDDVADDSIDDDEEAASFFGDDDAGDDEPKDNTKDSTSEELPHQASC